MQTEERASERAGTRTKSMLTSAVLGCKLAFLLAVCFTTQIAGHLKVQAHCPRPERLAPPSLSAGESSELVRTAKLQLWLDLTLPAGLSLEKVIDLADVSG